MKHETFIKDCIRSEGLRLSVYRTLLRHLRVASLIVAGVVAPCSALAAHLAGVAGILPLLTIAALTGSIAVLVGFLLSWRSACLITPIATRPVETLVEHLAATSEGLPQEFHWQAGQAMETVVLEEDLKRLDQRMKSMSRKMRLTIADLEKAKELANEQNIAKSKFLANMSHELRTPLNAILGYAMLLQEDASDDGNDAMVSDLLRIQQAGQNLLARINDILEISKIRAGKIKIEREVIDIPAFAASIVALHCDGDKTNGNDFSINIEDDIGIMVGDRENIQQCLINLLNNAFKFTENGQVSLSIERSEQKALPMVSFTVRDTGIGIDEQDIEALFIAFEQGDSGFTRKYGGTGLGLAITRNLARLMGGDCQVESVKGQGSTFRLILPAGSQAEVAGQPSSDEKAALAKLPHPDTSPYTPQHLQVLVIDDDKDALELIRRWLTQMGMTSVVTDSPDAGLALARQHKPDMILLDALLPNRSGYDLLTELRADEQIKDIPTVLITVDDDRRRAISVGASDYIRKPLSKDQLRSVVELYCGTVDGEILVIDDDDAAADLIKRSVEEAGFRTRRAANGRQGLAMADDQRPSAIVLDLAMPGLDGFGVLDHLKRHETLHDVPLIVLSSKEITLDQHRELAAAGQRFFTKAASTPRQIAQCLKEMVA